MFSSGVGSVQNFGGTRLAVIACWQFYTASREAAFEGDGYEAPWDFWRRGEALLRWGSGGANKGVVTVVSDRSGEFIERGGDTDPFVDCFTGSAGPLGLERRRGPPRR